jgi:hypothetical protein
MEKNETRFEPNRNSLLLNMFVISFLSGHVRRLLRQFHPSINVLFAPGEPYLSINALGTRSIAGTAETVPVLRIVEFLEPFWTLARRSSTVLGPEDDFTYDLQSDNPESYAARISLQN